MTAPGVSVRPLVDMTGDHAFNEVFFDGVRLPADHLLGEPNQGWRLAKVTLGNERVALSGEGVLWGRGPTANDLVDLVRATSRGVSARERDRLVRCWSHGEILRYLRLRLTENALKGRATGSDASLRKALADDHGQEVMGLAHDLAASAGMLADHGPLGVSGEEGRSWYWGFLYAQALTIGGGTSVVQRNIIAERVLGLPKDLSPRPPSPASAERSWASTRSAHPGPHTAAWARRGRCRSGDSSRTRSVRGATG